MKTPPSRAGVTLAELVITGTVLSVTLLIILPLFNATTQGTTPLEAGTLLSGSLQRAAAEIQGGLSTSKRLFGNDAAGRSFLARVTPSLPQSPLPGTLLASIDAGGALPGPAAATPSTSTGNSLLFAGAGRTVDLPEVLNGLGLAAAVRLNTYVFNYYYLAPDAGRSIGGKPARDLWEWRSAPCADYQTLAGLGDATEQHNAIAALVAPPNDVHCAFNPSAPDAAAAFTLLSSSAPWLSSAASQPLARDRAGKMVVLDNGSKPGSFNQSISPNTAGDFALRYAVPAYGKPDGDFPSGFEVLIVGPPEARRVLARIVMAAEGRFKGMIAFEQVVSATARDVW